MPPPMRALALLVASAAVLAGCTSEPPPPTDGTTPPEPPPSPPPTPPPDTPPSLPPETPPVPPERDTHFHERARLEPPGRLSAAERSAWPGGGAAFHHSDGGRTLDLFLSGPEGVKLFRNTTGGARVDATSAVGLDKCACRALSVAPADMDNDGDADLLVVVDGAAPRLYRNDNASFAALASGLPALPTDVPAAGWLDVDNDGLLDLLLLRAGADPAVYRNLNGSFEAAPESVWPAGAGAATTAAFVDLDVDGLLDVLLVGPQGFKAYRNGNGSFAPAPGFAGTNAGTTASAGDFDNSGTQDVLLAGDQGLVLLSNARGRSLRAIPAGLPTEAMWSAAFIDHDLDGNLDIVAVRKAGGLVLLRNTGNKTYEAVPEARSGLPAAGEFRGLAVGDFDHDGRSDLLATRLDGPATLYHNGNAAGHFFKVDPDGIQSNRDGVSARVVASGATTLLERYVSLGLGLGTSAPEVVFGLGSGNVTNLRIQWPSGTFQDQSIPADNAFNRILFASEEASLSEWGDNAC